MKHGFFTIENASEVLKCSSLEQAKVYAHAAVDLYLSKNKPLISNILKVRADIDRSVSVKSLAFTISNYVLAHPSEGLKVIR